MPYIRTIPPSEATGKVKEMYESGTVRCSEAIEQIV